MHTGADRAEMEMKRRHRAMMDSPARATRYRISGIRPWTSEGTEKVPQEVQTFFEGKEVDMDDLHALAAAFDAEIESAEQGGPRNQAVLNWHGHRYDLDLEPLA